MMVKSISRHVLIIICCIFVSSCSTVKKIAFYETKNRGGTVDHLADKLFRADSKKMRVLRGYVVTAALSRMATETPVDSNARDVIALQIAKTSERLDAALSCVEKGKCFFFDDLMFDFDKSLYRLTVSVLPKHELKLFIRRSAAVNSTALGTLFKLSKFAVVTGLRLAAIYRDSLDLQMHVAIVTLNRSGNLAPELDKVCKTEKATKIKNFLKTKITLENNQLIHIPVFSSDFRDKCYVTTLYHAYASGNGPVAQWSVLLKAWPYRNDRFLIPTKEAHFKRVWEVIKDSCSRMGKSTSSSVKQCINAPNGGVFNHS